MKTLRAESAPVLVCTAGDFYGTADVYNESKSHFVARMLGELGYDAIGVGEMDLNFGLASLVEDARLYRLPIVCANLQAKNDSLRVRTGGPESTAADRLGSAFPPYRIVTKAGARFGFLGLLSPATKTHAREATVESLTYVLGDPLEIAKTAVAELRPQCDVLVVLGHMDEEEARKLAEKVPGIDLVVLGHDPQGKSLGELVTVGDTHLLRATAQGQYIGQLDMRLGDDHHIAEVWNRLHVLQASYPDDPDMAKKLDQFDVDNRMIQKELFAKEQMKASADDPFAARYLGVGACQSCHLEQFNVYTGTRHAHAYATLASEFVQRDTNCVGCHVTGYGDAGGFQGVRMRGSMVDLVDVQCEACHGPGADHARDGSYRQKARESCVRCHTPNDDPDFNFDEDWPKIAH